MNILGLPTQNAAKAMVWAAAKGTTPFLLGVIPLYYDLAQYHGGVDPDVAVAQAMHETGWGKFGRAVTPAHNNFCGLKITKPVGPDTNPDDHMRFPTPLHGVAAHLDHLAIYAGAPGYPRLSTYDTRHFAFIYGKARTVEGLGGSWAPAPTYGTLVAVKAQGLKDFTLG